MGVSAPNDAPGLGLGPARLSTVPPTPEGLDLRERVLDATVRCVARWGVAKTTVDDVAREAGCSRATIYRVLPGGKAALLGGAARREADTALAALDSELAALDSLKDVLVAILVAGTRLLHGHPALTTVIAHEPALVAPHVSFDALGPLLSECAAAVSPTLERFVDPLDAWRTGEWMARIVVAYGFDDAAPLDLADESTARHFVQTYVLPGLATPALDPPGDPAGDPAG